MIPISGRQEKGVDGLPGLREQRQAPQQAKVPSHPKFDDGPHFVLALQAVGAAVEEQFPTNGPDAATD